MKYKCFACNHAMNSPGRGQGGKVSYRGTWKICLQHLKTLQGSGVVRRKPDRKSCCSMGKGGNSTLEGERSPGAGPGRDRWVPHRIHTSDVTILMSTLQLSKEEFNHEFC